MPAGINGVWRTGCVGDRPGYTGEAEGTYPERATANG